MDYIVLQRESDDFTDILSDPVIKKSVRTKILFTYHLILSFNREKDTSYAILKYGDDIVPMSSVITDRTPVMGVDYIPKNRKRLT
jgi:hypothetical protein